MEQKDRQMLIQVIQSSISGEEYAEQISKVEGRPFHVARDIVLGESRRDPDTVERRIDVHADEYIEGKTNNYSITYELTLKDMQEVDDEMKPYLN